MLYPSSPLEVSKSQTNIMSEKNLGPKTYVYEEIMGKKNSTRKLDRGLCLSSTKNCADYDSRGFEPATPVAGPATLRY